MSSRVQLVWPGGSGAGTLGAEPLGRGGEGSVWPVRVDPGVPAPAGPLVVKLYHPGADPQLAARRVAKVTAMLAAPPATDAICWPLAAVSGSDGQVGFVMTALPADSHRPWASFANAADRRKTAAAFSVRYALAACRNLVIAAGAVHAAGHVLGDVNESNVFIGADATVRIVDADSAQVRTSSGQVFRCEVGKPEYTAPELAGRPLRECDRTPATDMFGFGVLIFQLLTGGAHPTDGAPIDLDADPPSVTERIAHRWTPALQPPPGCPLRPVARVPAAALPSRLVPLLVAAFDVNPARRPPLAAFAAVLTDIGAHLRACPTQPGHAFDSRDGRCGWCAHAAAGNPDPWAPPAARPAPTQQALPALPLQAAAAAPTAARRGPAVSQPPSVYRPGVPLLPANYGAGLYGAGPYGAGTPGGPAGMPPGGAPAPGPAAAPLPQGRRTMLIGPGGTLQPRPPLLWLAAGQPGLALNCAWSELPAACKPVPATRRPGSGQRGRWLAALTAAAVLALLAGTALLPELAAWLLSAHAAVTIPPPLTGALGALSALGSSAAVSVLAWRHLRRRGARDALATWRGGDTATYARVVAMYGPGLLLTAAAGLVTLVGGALWWLGTALLGRRA